MNNIKIRVIDCHIAMYDRKFSGNLCFLLLKRSKNKIYPGIWQGVTGKIKKEEIPYKTAIRELKEETGLIPNKVWTIDKVNMFYDAETNIMNVIPVFGVMVNKKNIILSDEHIDYQWCDINNAIKLLTWEQQKKGLKIFYEMLTENKERLKIMEINV